jgi:hypothetical protein
MPMNRRLFVQRFLVAEEDEPDRPPGVRYDSAQSLTVGPDGRPFVEDAEPAATATETKSFPGDRDRTTLARTQVTKVMRDRPLHRPAAEKTAERRDRVRSGSELVGLWTNTRTRRDPGERTASARLYSETHVRRDMPHEQPQQRPR